MRLVYLYTVHVYMYIVITVYKYGFVENVFHTQKINQGVAVLLQPRITVGMLRE